MGSPAFNPNGSYSAVTFDPKAAYDPAPADQTPPAKMGFVEHLQKAVDLAATPQPGDKWSDNIGRGIVSAVAQPLMHPLQTAGAIAKTLLPGGALAVDPQGAVNSNPLVTAYHDAHQRGVAPALERVAGQVGGQAAIGGTLHVADPEPIPSPIPKNVPYTANHAAAFEGAIAPATAMGKNFIPQNVTPEALPAIRSTASRMAQGTPIEQRVVQAATAPSTPPLQRLGAYQRVVQTALNDLEQQHAPALAQAAKTPVDTAPLVQKLQAMITPTMDAADSSAIRNLIHRTQQAKTIGDLNTFRQQLNTETAPDLGKVQLKQGSNVSSEAANKLAGEVRDAYYDNLQQATGTDYTPLKKQESNLLTTLQSLQSQQAPMAKAEATFAASNPYSRLSTPKETAGNIANVIKEPKTTITQTILRESPATKLSTLLQKSLTDLPAPPTSTGVPAPPVVQAPRAQLPAHSGGAYPMPGKVPYSPGMTAGEQSAALLQYLRRRQQLGLPSQAQPIPLSPPK